jgi:hypothetical protein
MLGRWTSDAPSNNQQHTISLVEEKGYPREVWVVEIDLVEDWLRSVDDETYDLIAAALAILKEQGPGLGRPLVDTIVGSRHNNMKELRPGSSGAARCASCSPSIPGVGQFCW